MIAFPMPNNDFKFESLFMETPASQALMRGPDFIFEMVNESYKRLVGDREILGKAMIEALPEIKEQPFLGILKNVFESGETYQAKEVKVLLRKKPADEASELETHFLDFTYKRILDENEKPYGIFAFIIDVTEKVISRSHIEIEKSKLEAVFSNATASLAILSGIENRFEKVNTSYSALFNNRELIGKTLVEALPELMGQKFPEIMKNVFLTGVPYFENEAKAYLKSSEEGPIEEWYVDQSYTRITTDNGKPYGVLVHAIVVTERVRTRTLLTENNERFRLALDAANLGTWDFDIETGFIEWSQRTKELFGVSTEEQVPLRYALDRIHPDDQEMVHLAIAKAIDPAGEGKYEIEYRIIHDDQTLRWVSLKGQAFYNNTPNGKVTKNLAGTILDITEQVNTEQTFRHNEKQLRMMADLMPQVVWTARADGVLDYTNERWFQYSGSRDPEKWLEFVHPDDLSVVITKWTESFTTGKPYDAEFRLKRNSDQTYRWFLVRAQVYLNTKGNIERWFGTCTDIDEQKEALALRGEFMSIASHELRTPLTSMKLQTQSMRRSFQKENSANIPAAKVDAIISNNEKQIDRLIRLVDDMLDFSRIEAGKVLMIFQESNMNELIKEVYSLHVEQFISEGSTISFHSEGQSVCNVDRFRIEQVIINLLTNATRYGSGKPIHLEVQELSGQCVVSVQDNGIGITKENIERIFNRFERAVAANEISGLGLGLYISRQIIEGHNGKIWAESQPGKGSTFKFTIPLKPN